MVLDERNPSGDPATRFYACLIAAGFSALFFSNLPIYGGLFLWSVQPVHFMFLFGLALFPLLIGRRGLSLELAAPLVLWCLAYLGICALWYATFGGGSPEPFKARALAVLFLLSTFTLFVQNESIVRCVRLTLFACVVVGALVNVYDISHPFALVPATSEFAKLGRAAGLYINPNQSGLALLLGFVLTIDLCRASLRPVYALIVLIAVVLTGSRTAIAGALMTIVLLVRSGALNYAQVYAMVAVSAVAVVGLWGAVGATLAALQLDLDALYDRFAWFMSLGSTADFSQQERVVLAEEAWELFANNPILGAGLGATELWNQRAPPHNMYLLGMTDFGALGVLVFPALIGCAVGGLKRMFERRTAPFTCLTLWSGLFSHSLIGEHYFMIAVSLMAALSAHQLRLLRPAQTPSWVSLDGSPAPVR